MTATDSIPAVLDESARRFPDREAVVDGELRPTFADLRRPSQTSTRSPRSR
jgi:acyl-CoA synthetase (AMP-forming)/AMP-acid ligase II